MKTINKFNNQFTYSLEQSPCTLIYLSKYYLNKAFNKFIQNLVTKQSVLTNQVIGVIFKVRFSDGSIRSMSTFRKGTIESKSSFTTLFKHFINLRKNDYKPTEYKVVEIIFDYHIYPIDYIITDTDLTLNELTDKNHIEYKEDKETNIKYMDPLKVFKLPLSFAGSLKFIQDFKILNKNVSLDTIINDYNIKYKLNVNLINNTEVEVTINLQDHPSIIIYKFKDKLISIPKLDKSEILIERSVMSKTSQVYIIDCITSEILIIKSYNANRKPKGFMTTLAISNNFVKNHERDLAKFITLDIETITNNDLLKKEGDQVYFEPILIAAHDAFNNQSYKKLLRTYSDFKNNPINFNHLNEFMIDDRIKQISEFLFMFMKPDYHKFVIYAHNLSNFDAYFIMGALVLLSKEYGIKVEPIMRDTKLISVKVRFGYVSENKYKYYIEFHDSLQILLSSLSKLSKSFLSDKPELQKMDNKEIIQLLISEESRNELLENREEFSKFIYQLEKYCIMDCVSLAHVIHRFGILIFERWKINIHTYPTVSSLALAIFRTHYLISDDLIPMISGSIYRDISKAYHGGHTDVYRLYSNKDVHSYDYSSMYPTQMVNHEMPVGKITKFEGNPLITGESITSLCRQHAFIKCSVFVDKSLNRPLYQTTAKINGELRSVCATGTFLNQWVFVPELAYYEELTKGKIRILPDSITKGYLFESKIIFKDYINELYSIKSSVSKNDPMYLISKILMNSLYGRMGLKQELNEYTFMNGLELEKFSATTDLTIKEIIEWESFDKSLVVTSKNSDEVNLNSSVPIAAAITAYARMELAPILLDDSLDILYIDTDSYKSTQKITELERYKHLDHDGLGALKYEETYSESLFLLPKVYGGIIKDSGSEFTKVKGFKDKVEFNELKDLLFKNQELKLTQDKWMRNMIKSEIKIRKSPYALSLNDNKRIIDLKTFTTSPYHLDCYDSEANN